MAALHAASGAGATTSGLQTDAAATAGMFAPATIAPELLAARRVPARSGVADEGWRRLPDVAPGLAELVLPFHDDPDPAGRRAGHHAGHLPARRLEDGEPGLARRRPHGPARLGLPRRRPRPAGTSCGTSRSTGPVCRESKDAVDRDATAPPLEAAGVDTGGWWERQLGLSSIAIMVCFGWEKAVGDPDELAWWADRVEDARRWLG